jgi:hypothetical protein
MKKLINDLSKFKYTWLIIILVACIPASIPLLRSGFFHFSDESHIANLYEMIRTISSGQLPPRMSPDFSWGYGYPLFNFYYPLPYYLGSLFFLFTRSLIISLKLTFLITIPLSGIFMFLWLRNHTDKWIAVMASILYIYTPYRAVDLYVRGAVGECLAFVFFPLIGWAIDKIAKERTLRNIGILGLITGLFVLSHNIAPILIIPWFLIYFFLKYDGFKKIKGITTLVFGYLLGAGISTFWWLPGFIEKKYLQTQTPFNYLDHFPFIKQLIYSSFKYGASVPGPNDDISFQIGIVNLIIIVICGFILIRQKERKTRMMLLFLLLSFFFTVFLMNIRSNFIWKIFPLATYIQFPWRLLMITTFLTSVMFIFIKDKRLSLFLVVIAFLLTVGYFKPSEYFHPNDDYFLKRFFANRTLSGVRSEVSKEYVGYSEDYLLLPIWVYQKPDSISSAKIESKTAQITNINELNAVNYTADIVAPKESDAFINFYYFPGWNVYLNGSKVSIEILKPYGNMKVNIPKGKWKIQVKWEETGERKVADSISLLSLMVSLVFIFKPKKKYAETL